MKQNLTITKTPRLRRSFGPNFPFYLRTVIRLRMLTTQCLSPSTVYSRHTETIDGPQLTRKILSEGPPWLSYLCIVNTSILIIVVLEEGTVGLRVAGVFSLQYLRQ